MNSDPLKKESILEINVLVPIFAENKRQLRVLASGNNLNSKLCGIPRSLEVF